jgi:hypothetical protein
MVGPAATRNGALRQATLFIVAAIRARRPSFGNQP